MRVYSLNFVCTAKTLFYFLQALTTFLMHLITDKRLFVPATGGTFAASEDCQTFYKDLEQIEGKSKFTPPTLVKI